nr:hypothetical protein Iba_chr04cCG18650 [Ipomoea batatas]
MCTPTIPLELVTPELTNSMRLTQLAPSSSLTNQSYTKLH